MYCISLTFVLAVYFNSFALTWIRCKWYIARCWTRQPLRHPHRGELNIWLGGGFSLPHENVNGGRSRKALLFSYRIVCAVYDKCICYFIRSKLAFEWRTHFVISIIALANGGLNGHQHEKCDDMAYAMNTRSLFQRHCTHTQAMLKLRQRNQLIQLLTNPSTTTVHTRERNGAPVNPSDPSVTTETSEYTMDVR